MIKGKKKSQHFIKQFSSKEGQTLWEPSQNQQDFEKSKSDFQGAQKFRFIPFLNERDSTGKLIQQKSGEKYDLQTPSRNGQRVQVNFLQDSVENVIFQEQKDRSQNVFQQSTNTKTNFSRSQRSNKFILGKKSDYQYQVQEKENGLNTICQVFSGSSLNKNNPNKNGEEDLAKSVSRLNRLILKEGVIPEVGEQQGRVCQTPQTGKGEKQFQWVHSPILGDVPNMLGSKRRIVNTSCSSRKIVQVGSCSFNSLNWQEKNRISEKEQAPPLGIHDIKREQIEKNTRTPILAKKNQGGPGPNQSDRNATHQTYYDIQDTYQQIYFTKEKAQLDFQKQIDRFQTKSYEKNSAIKEFEELDDELNFAKHFEQKYANKFSAKKIFLHNSTNLPSISQMAQEWMKKVQVFRNSQKKRLHEQQLYLQAQNPHNNENNPTNHHTQNSSTQQNNPKKKNLNNKKNTKN